jgi:hypothetical protein
MNDLKPIDLKDPRIKSSSPAGATRRRITIVLLVTIIALAMIVWLGFLGWGLLEMLWAVGSYVTKQ